MGLGGEAHVVQNVFILSLSVSKPDFQRVVIVDTSAHYHLAKARSEMVSRYQYSVGSRQRHNAVFIF